MRAPRGGTPKLLPRYMGPFKITEKLGAVAYKLDLPVHLKMHPVFHVSLLKPYLATGRCQPPPPPVEIEGDFYYKVERVIDHRWRRIGRSKPKLEFLVKWLGYAHEHDTWEPEINLETASEYVQQYFDARRAAGDDIEPPPTPPAAERAATAPGHRPSVAADGTSAKRKANRRGNNNKRRATSAVVPDSVSMHRRKLRRVSGLP